MKILDSIAAGQEITLQEACFVKGNIGKGAVISIENGGIEVKGDIDDNVVIRQIGTSGGVIVVGRGNVIASGNVIISGSGRVVVNGVDVTAQVAEGTANNEPQTIVVGGKVGNHVSIESASEVSIDGSCGNGLRIKTGGGFFAGENIDSDANIRTGNSCELQNIGENAVVRAGNSIRAKNIASNASFNAGNSIRVRNIGEKGNFQAGNSIDVQDVAMGSSLRAGNNVEAQNVGSQCRINAGNRINVDFADASAELHAARVTVRQGPQKQDGRSAFRGNVVKGDVIIINGRVIIK